MNGAARFLAFACAATLAGAACSSSSSGTNGSTAGGDGGGGGNTGSLRYFEIVVGGSPCPTEPVTPDAQGLVPWRYVIAYPSGGSTLCQMGLTALDSSTDASLTSAAHLSASALCELPQVSGAGDAGTCVPDSKPEWCYVTDVTVGSTHCMQAALASAGAASAPQGSRYFILF